MGLVIVASRRYVRVMSRDARGDDREEKLLTRPFVLMGIADLAYFTSVGVAIHTLPLYATGPIGTDEAGAGLAYGAFGVMALLCRPFVGRLSDVHGRLPLMILGASLAALGMALFPLTDSLAVVIGIRVLQGVGEAAFFVASFALLADIAPPSRMGEALSYNSLSLYLGIALGPPVGEVLLVRWGFGSAWLGGAALAALAVLVSLAITEPERSPAEGGWGHLIHRPAVPISVGFGASLIAMGGFLAFATLHAEDIDMADTSLALLVYGITVVTCRVIFAKVPDRLPSLPLAAMSLVAVGSGLLIAAIWQSTSGLLVGAVVLAVGITFTTPAFFSAVFATAAPSERGAASATASAFLDLGLGVGPILLGVVAGAHGIPWAFAAGAGIAYAGAVWTGLLARDMQRRHAS